MRGSGRSSRRSVHAEKPSRLQKEIRDLLLRPAYRCPRRKESLTVRKRAS